MKEFTSAKRGLDTNSLASARYPLEVNCIGAIELPMDFETVNEEGRKDYYFFYLVQGTMEIEGEKETVSAKAGSVVVFYPNTRYCYRNRSGAPIKYYFIHYTGAQAERFTKECGFADHRVYFAGFREKLIASIDRLHGEYIHRREGYELLSGSELGALLVTTMRYCHQREGRDLFASLEYMNKNYALPIGMEELAAMEHLSPGRYRTVFSSLVGMSPKEYLTKLRIDKGMELLSATDLSVSEVGALVGFSDPLYFSRIFRKKTGISPLHYRKK